MIRVKKAPLLLSVLALLIASMATAATLPAQKSYLLKLLYSEKDKSVALVANEAPYLLLPIAYTSSISPSFADVTGEVVDSHGFVVVRFGFNLPDNVLTGGTAVIQPRAPYADDARRIDLYREGGKILSIDVSAGAVCQANAFCDVKNGETAENCPVDCHVAAPSPVPNVISPPPVNTIAVRPAAPSDIGPFGGVEPTPSPVASVLSQRPLLALISFVVGMAIFAIWLIMKRKNES